MGLEFFDKAKEIMEKLEETQGEHIHEAAGLISESIRNGGILQAFGSGHSYAGAIEVCGRAGGLIPSKVIKDKAEGMYESVEGNAPILMRTVDIQPNDIIILISNSGRNPMSIEMADYIKKKGNKLIVVTALEVSKNSTSRHSSGKLLYEFADVVLDNQSMFGDAALEIEGLDTRVCGTSSFSTCLLLQQTIYEAVKDMVEKGYEPPVYKSANIDGGREFNNILEQKYGDRIWHI
ncbi:SIS domain-containing protein [Luxibacter massiliensis]|uniref:SIS domain-containing protein n=1 Tax=Luxibacter massiliensis TaxID=2219695 RepID=UPI000F0604EB|nr:SIS domain-containing protein [Luxibacter massiliensis]